LHLVNTSHTVAVAGTRFGTTSDTAVCSPIQTRNTPLRSAGFTLIELMITVCIIGVLSAIAVPAYQLTVRNSHRLDARSAILDFAMRQEKFYSIYNFYTSDATALGYATAFPVRVSSSGSASFYNLSVVASVPPATPTYTVTAAPTGGQTSDLDCYNYRMTQSGAKSNSSASNTVLATSGCW